MYTRRYTKFGGTLASLNIGDVSTVSHKFDAHDAVTDD
jgi:hypothetical protein